jgi:excinuclease UvrABC nuclease subunit
MKRRRLDVLADHFGLSTSGRHRGLGDARMAGELLCIMIESAEKMGLGRLDRLLEHQHQGASGRRIESHVPPEVLAAIPESPGVYLMRNERGELLYVGKARRLRQRVASYFNGGMGLKPKTIDLVNHVWAIETRTTRSSLDAALLEKSLILAHKPPYNRMLKSAPPAYFLKLDLLDPFPRLMISTRLTTRRGILHLGPFVGRISIDRAVRVISRLLGLRVCSGKIAPSAEFSPCIYGQMGHCLAPCNLSISEDAYGAQVRRAIDFLRGRNSSLIGRLAAARDQAASAMRFEEAQRYKRDLDTIRTLAIRERRLSQAVVENNLVIVTGDGDDRAAHLILGGRLALSVELNSPDSGEKVAAFVAENFERYRTQPIKRDELESIAIVARWLRERDRDEGQLIYLNGPFLPRALLDQAAPAANASAAF